QNCQNPGLQRRLQYGEAEFTGRQTCLERWQRCNYWRHSFWPSLDWGWCFAVTRASSEHSSQRSAYHFWRCCASISEGTTDGLTPVFNTADIFIQRSSAHSTCGCASPPEIIG